MKTYCPQKTKPIQKRSAGLIGTLDAFAVRVCLATAPDVQRERRHPDLGTLLALVLAGASALFIAGAASGCGIVAWHLHGDPSGGRTDVFRISLVAACAGAVPGLLIYIVVAYRVATRLDSSDTNTDAAALARAAIERARRGGLRH